MTSLDTLVADARQGRISRRAFTTGAATFGIGAALAGSIFEAAAAPASRTGTLRASFQDGGKTLIVAIPQPTVQLDPALAGNNGYGDIIVVHDNVTEGLTRFVLGSAEIEPALAESWTASDDGLVYTFDLRAGVTFHDGTPLDADAVLTNIHRNIDPAHPLYSDQYSYSGITYAEVASAEKTGDLQVTLTLNRPITLLPGNLATFAGGLVSPAALEMGADYSQHAAGTGPFKVESFTPDVELVLVANDTYWGGRPALDRVIFRTIAEDAVRIAELRAASIDVANQIDLKDVASLASEASLQVITGSFLNVQFLSFNQTLAPFDDVRVRQAFQHAINKQNIADVVFYGNYTLGAGPIAPGLIGYDETLAATYAYDPEGARALLTEAGQEGLTFDLYSRTNSFWPTISQLIQADLAEIGVTANIVSLQDPEFFGTINASEAPAFINDWTWDNGDADNIVSSLYASERAKTRLGYQRAEVVDLVAQAQVERDPAVRAELYKQVQTYILEDSASVFLGYPSRAIAAQADVKNLQLSPLGSIVLRAVDRG